jgi:hypothetical protein
MPFCGSVSVPNIINLIKKAIKKGTAHDKNRGVTVTGTLKRYDTLAGPFMQLKGIIEFGYYDSRVLTVDFVNRRITDHGMSSYGSDTRKTLSGYVEALITLFKQDIPARSVRYRYSRWTAIPRPKTAQHRFMRRAPWVDFDYGNVWFRWDLYDDALVDLYDQSEAFLRKDQNWRWFEYDWDEQGQWSRKFIDAKAERRYRQREKRCLRTSKTTKTISNASSLPAVMLPQLMLPWTSTTPSGCLHGTEAPLSTFG